MAWDNYLDGKDIDHVIVREDGAEGLRGTMEDELFAREERRQKIERHQLKDELRSWYVDQDHFLYREFNRFSDHVFGQFTHNSPR